LQFTISARDPDHDPIRYSATNLPNGARINSETGQFTWTPTYDQAGTYTVTFIASDGTLSDRKSCIIKVNNVPMPDLTTGAITYTVSGNGLYTFTAPIKNIGDMVVRTPFYVYFYVDGKVTGSRILSYILPGQTITVHFPWPGVKGAHVIKITADATNSIKESDENNNSAQIRVVVK
jgi:subtilase family serine protease